MQSLFVMLAADPARSMADFTWVFSVCSREKRIHLFGSESKRMSFPLNRHQLFGTAMIEHAVGE
jgi:hypothetical protein